MGRKYLIKKMLKEGKRIERIFCELTGARKGTFSEDVNEHTDVWLDGKSVDVKGVKRSHRKGFVLLEFLNVRGQKGWCSPAGADKIAFLMPDGFYIVDNEWLYKEFTALCYHTSQGNVLRKGSVMAEDALYKLVGRPNRKDVFTYITLDDLKEGEYEFIEIDGIY